MIVTNHKVECPHKSIYMVRDRKYLHVIHMVWMIVQMMPEEILVMEIQLGGLVA